ncbi:MAG: ester cyclase [Actinobacteria bacterium]|nr:ester cyclase [Actinomycetota bacterium]
MSSERASEVMRMMVTMFSTGDLSDLEETVHPAYLDHQGVRGEPVRGAAGFASVVAAARAGFTNLDVTVEDLITNTDRAAARLQWSVVQADGKVTRQTLEIVRTEDGMAVEHWGGQSETLVTTRRRSSVGYPNRPRRNDFRCVPVRRLRDHDDDGLEPILQAVDPLV